MKYFKQRHENDDSYFFVMNLGDDGTLHSVLLTDWGALFAYVQFCYVLFFHVTYKTNKFRMSLSQFSGINQQMQSNLFGDALLKDETTKTFVWLFSQFRMCMFGRPLNAIILDQDATIYKVVSHIFPRHRHRYCMWQVRKHEFFSKKTFFFPVLIKCQSFLLSICFLPKFYQKNKLFN